MDILVAILWFVLIDVVFVWTAISIVIPLALYRDPKFVGGFLLLVLPRPNLRDGS